MKPITLLMLLMALGAGSVYAAVDRENAYLARIKQVLTSLEPLIRAAEQERSSYDRIQFHYDWLRDDVHRIQLGITEKLKQSPLEPRNIQPIRGDYLIKAHL